MKLAYVQLALAMAFVGANVAVGKIIVEHVPIFLFSEIRFLIALLFLIPMSRMSKTTKRVPGKKSQWGILFLQAFFGVFLFSVLMLHGVQYTSATAAGIITSTVPAIIALLSFFFLKEKMSVVQAFSICLSVLGIAIITYQAPSSNTDPHSFLLGNALVFGAVISEALFTIFAKKLSDLFTPVQMAVWVNIIGFLLFMPFAIKETVNYNFMNLTFSMWLLIIYYAVTASVLSFILWYQGVTKVKANIAGIFTGFLPVTAALAGIVILKEPFGWSQSLGILSVLGAIFFGTRVTTSNKSSRNDAA
ncbi:DMT family transporter [Bacillus sp. BRMEA1]|uniref:DMT family transporter n=1 Tax=Neobacillus endophyticus TaxID=2738405 RepID=UPI001566FC9E|nr:DMT family transporter [Neobacillus endophyticus]NRD76904.1 DMT family transporter [Neobacillus endophyticus]